MASERPIVTALQISDLSFSYTDRKDALSEISFEVFSGERVGLIGPNGAGKTTLFMTICGVLKPDKGSIIAMGEPVKSGNFRPEIGMVFQNPDDQLFCPSVRDDIAFGPQNMGLSREDVQMRVTEALTAVNCLELADRSPHHLSGGEKRMVSIAGVLAMHPELVVYDEPSANLDIRSRRRVIDLLKDSPQTILISSHDLELILELCDRVILIDKGKIIASGEPAEIMGNEELMLARGQEKPHSLVPHRAVRHQH